MTSKFVTFIKTKLVGYLLISPSHPEQYGRLEQFFESFHTEKEHLIVSQMSICNLGNYKSASLPLGVRLGKI